MDSGGEKLLGMRVLAGFLARPRVAVQGQMSTPGGRKLDQGSKERGLWVCYLQSRRGREKSKVDADQVLYGIAFFGRPGTRREGVLGRFLIV